MHLRRSPLMGLVAAMALGSIAWATIRALDDTGITEHMRQSSLFDSVQAQPQASDTIAAATAKHSAPEVPVMVVEDHNHALTAWMEATLKGLLPREGVTLVHIDSHSDLQMSEGAAAGDGGSQMPPDAWHVSASETASQSSHPDSTGSTARSVSLEAEYARSFTRSTAIDNFIFAAARMGLVDHVIYIHPNVTTPHFVYHLGVSGAFGSQMITLAYDASLNLCVVSPEEAAELTAAQLGVGPDDSDNGDSSSYDREGLSSTEAVKAELATRLLDEAEADESMNSERHDELSLRQCSGRIFQPHSVLVTVAPLEWLLDGTLTSGYAKHLKQAGLKYHAQAHAKLHPASSGFASWWQGPVILDIDLDYFACTDPDHSLHRRELLIEDIQAVKGALRPLLYQLCSYQNEETSAMIQNEVSLVLTGMESNYTSALHQLLTFSCDANRILEGAFSTDEYDRYLVSASTYPAHWTDVNDRPRLYHDPPLDAADPLLQWRGTPSASGADTHPQSASRASTVISSPRTPDVRHPSATARRLLGVTRAHPLDHANEHEGDETPAHDDDLEFQPVDDRWFVSDDVHSTKPGVSGGAALPHARQGTRHAVIDIDSSELSNAASRRTKGASSSSRVPRRSNIRRSARSKSRKPRMRNARRPRQPVSGRISTRSRRLRSSKSRSRGSRKQAAGTRARYRGEDDWRGDDATLDDLTPHSDEELDDHTFPRASKARPAIGEIHSDGDNDGDRDVKMSLPMMTTTTWSSDELKRVQPAVKQLGPLLQALMTVLSGIPPQRRWKLSTYLRSLEPPFVGNDTGRPEYVPSVADRSRSFKLLQLALNSSSIPAAESAELLSDVRHAEATNKQPLPIIKPQFITIARSVDDGYTPAEIWPSLEHAVVQSLRRAYGEEAVRVNYAPGLGPAPAPLRGHADLDGSPA